MLMLHGARYSPHNNLTEQIWAALKPDLPTSPTAPSGRSGPLSRRDEAPKAPATRWDRNRDAHEIAHGTRRNTLG
jgi:hypothetical protein